METVLVQTLKIYHAQLHLDRSEGQEAVRFQARATAGKTRGAVPSSQSLPCTPGGQRHCPVTGSQEPPFWHLQTLAQPLPCVPGEQAVERAGKMNGPRNPFPSLEMKRSKTPVIQTEQGKSPFSQVGSKQSHILFM